MFTKKIVLGVLTTLVLLILAIFLLKTFRFQPQTTKHNYTGTVVTNQREPYKNGVVSNVTTYHNSEIGLSFSYPKEWGEIKLSSGWGSFSSASQVEFIIWPISYTTTQPARQEVGHPSCLLEKNQSFLIKEERSALTNSGSNKTCTSTYSLIPDRDPRHSSCTTISIGNPLRQTIMRWYEINPSCGQHALAEGQIIETKSYTLYSQTQRVEFRLALKSFSPGDFTLDEINNFDFMPYIQRQENVVGKEALNDISQFDEMIQTVRITK